jgi:hypothetical protein
VLDRITRALREHWDPIGLGQASDLPANEYQRYAPAVLLLLREGADDRRIARHLSRLERTSIGLDSRPPEVLLSVVRAIRVAAQVTVEPEA